MIAIASNAVAGESNHIIFAGPAPPNLRSVAMDSSATFSSVGFVTAWNHSSRV
jgi:hypothetical protein